MALWLRVLSHCAEDSDLVPRTYIAQLITTCNSSFRASHVLFWPLYVLSGTIYVNGAYTYMHVLTQKLKVKI